MEIRPNTEMNEKILNNQGLVHYLLKKMEISPNNYDDLFQIGMLGLIKAVYTFDTSKNIQFSTYAYTCIQNEINMYFRKTNKHEKNVSINSTIYETKDGGELLLEDTLVDTSSLNFIHKIEDRDMLEKTLSFILNCFSNRERFLLLLSATELSQKQIADRLCVCQSHVCRQKRKLQNQLRNYIHNFSKPESEIFLVSISNNMVNIIFNTNDRKKFHEASEKACTFETVENFNIMYKDTKIIMCFPTEPQYFLFVANILYEAEHYGVKFINTL